MSNGHGNCILGVCCPPFSSEQRAALAADIVENVDGVSQETAEIAAMCVFDEYELAPAGSLSFFQVERRFHGDLRRELSAVMDGKVARAITEHVYKHYDVAPAGSLAVMKSEIARLARENP